MAQTNPDFLSCDWGTTSFRLRWVRGAEGVVWRELREPAGIKSLQEQLPPGAAMHTPAREEVFGRFLRAKLEALLAGQPPPSVPLPLVISGMASSSVGWRELPYAPAPCPLDGRGLRVEELRWNQPDWVGPTWLVSGLATGHDMMRGEETEILGLFSDPNLAPLRERCLLILPGTHSKHVRIEQNAVVDWRTFMTGELFEVLGRHSLLRASLEPDTCSAGLRSESDRAAFRAGVMEAKQHGLPGSLFRVRTRTVLEQQPTAANTWFFSGLLIGAELSALSDEPGQDPVLLAAAPGLAGPYALALEIIAGESVPWRQVPVEQVERATATAHAMLIRHR